MKALRAIDCRTGNHLYNSEEHITQGETSVDRDVPATAGQEAGATDSCTASQ
jgi:hypothetical protein